MGTLPAIGKRGPGPALFSYSFAMRYIRTVNAPPSTGSGQALRLSPEMVSRKLQALDFIKGYIARWGHSPSHAEVGAHLGVSRQRARELVRQLSREAQLRKIPGKRRGLEVIGSGAITVADAMLRLKEAGWRVDDAAHVAGELQPPLAPLRDASEQALSNNPLPGLPRLTHDPPSMTGVGINDKDERGAAAS